MIDGVEVDMEFDPSRFPFTSAYLSRLPRGIASYPECKVKADVHEDLSTEFPQLLDSGKLPAIARDYLSGRYTEKWLPETIGLSLVLLPRDVIFKTDEEYLEWSRIFMGRMFAKPVYKIMMHVFSSALIVMGAAKRWGSFHQGSILQVDRLRKIDGLYRTVGRLTYPPHLFSGLLLPHLASTYMAALEANKAQSPRVEAHEISPTEAHFHVSWEV